MYVLAPPLRSRLRFWLLGLRLPVEHRPWVAAQIMRPGYAIRRLRALVVIQLVCYVIPQLAFALHDHSRWRLVLPLVLLGSWDVCAVRSRRMTPAMLARLLAYHGVTADGALVEPVSPWADNPLGRLGLALLSAQVLLFSSGIAIAADRISARQDCAAVPPDVLAELSGDIGVPRPGPGFPAGIPGFPHDPPIVGVVPQSPLLFARQVPTVFDGIHYVGAYVRTDSGRLVGPAVWRVIEPGRTFLLPARQVSALEPTPRVLTPSLGFSYGGSPDPDIGKAKDCARAAR